MKLDIGCGRVVEDGYIGVDKAQILRADGSNIVDIILDLDKEVLPYKDNEIEAIKANDVLEHVQNIAHVMNECHRVLSKDGILWGHVPICGTVSHYKDPTHVRCFIRPTFGYFTGESGFMKNRPEYPRYADYGFLPWELISLEEANKIDGIYQLLEFKLRPIK